MFTAAGGEIVGAVRMPLKNPDFAPFIQRIKDAKPEAVFLFVPAGEQARRVHEGASRSAAWPKAGIKLIATGDITDDDVLDAMGDAGAGRDHHASTTRRRTTRPRTSAFVKAYAESTARAAARTSWRSPATTACA